MADYVLRKRYSNHYGIDLKSNDLVKDERFASEIENAQYRKNGTIEKRKGYHAHFNDVGGYGLFTYNRIDPSTGDPDVYELTVDNNLHRSVKTTINVEYLGTFPGTFFNNKFVPDEDEFRLIIEEDTNTVKNFSLGSGIDTLSPVTIQDLIDEVDSSPNRVETDKAETGSTNTVINATGHAVQVGDVIIFKSGDIVNEESVVQSINANDFTVSPAFSAAPANDDKFDALRQTKAFVAVPGIFLETDEAEAGSTTTVINATAHNAEENDWIVFKEGNAKGDKSQVTSTTANTITLTTALSSAPATGDNFDIYKFEEDSDLTLPATFLTVSSDEVIYQKSHSTFAKKWVQIYSPTSNPLSAYFSNIAKDDFINATFAQASNSVFVGTGYDETMKFDGQTFYRAGLPTPDEENYSVGQSAGSIQGTNYVHRIRYLQYDAAGQIVEGNIIDSDALDSDPAGFPATEGQFDLTIPSIGPSSGFNTNCAISDGAQSSVTTDYGERINVDDGSGGSHTLQKGDTAYFFESVGSTGVFYKGVEGQFITRNVNRVDGNQIHLSGAAFSIADSMPISNNLRIGVYRNKSSGTAFPQIFYLIAEIPNNSFSAGTQIYADVVTDTNIDDNPERHLFLLEPSTDRSPPPKGKYLSMWNANMMLSGNLDNPNFLYFSDIDGPEYFPSDSNILNVENVTGDIVTGIVQNSNGFYIFKEISVGWVSGDINSGAFRLEWRSLDTGCEAHHTVTEVEGKIFWWSPNGPYWSAGGSPPLPVGRNQDGAGRIEPVMDQFGLSSDLVLKTKQAVAINDRREQKWIVFLPATSSLNSVEYANDNSRIFVYDYTRDAWLEWANYNMMGGATTSGEEFYLMERRFSVSDSAIKHYTYRRLNLNDSIDYQDHTSPISFRYATQWEALGDPSVLKRFLEVKLFFVEDFFNNDLNLLCTQEINYIFDDPRIQFTLSAASGGYGENEYGNNPYGDYAETTVRHALNRDRSRSMRLIFQNSDDQTNVFITGWELEIATAFRQAFKQ